MGDQPDTISKHRSFGRATTVRRRSSPHSDNLKEISTGPAIALKVSAARSAYSTLPSQKSVFGGFRPNPSLAGASMSIARPKELSS